jgi:hypothetical protein
MTLNTMALNITTYSICYTLHKLHTMLIADVLSVAIEQCTLKNADNGLNTNIYSNFETSVGQSYNLYTVLFIFSTPVLIKYLAASDS